MENERSWILIGNIEDNLWWGRRSHRTEGVPTAVDFDYEYALEREEKHGDVIGWLHTHPGMPAYTSGRDIKTMNVWSTCFGKPLICAIKGNDGLKAWLWPHDESEGIRCQVKKLDNYLVGTIPDLVEWQEIEAAEMPFVNALKEKHYIAGLDSENIDHYLRTSQFVEIGSEDDVEVVIYPFICEDFKFYIKYNIDNEESIVAFSETEFERKWPKLSKRVKDQIYNGTK